MNGMFGCADGDSIQPPNPNRYFTLHTADIVIPYMPAWHLFWDYWIITDCARELGGWEEQQALTIATEIVNTFRRNDRSSIDKCLKIAEKFLGKNTHTHKIYDGGAEDVLVTGIGHCHIDTAWLWPFDETKRKVARSWATQVDLMDRYEEHRFACSQAQQWKWLEQYYPLLFEKVKRKVEAGKFIPIGGTWVEMVSLVLRCSADWGGHEYAVWGSVGETVHVRSTLLRIAFWIQM
jgi:alpha-mannosidase